MAAPNPTPRSSSPSCSAACAVPSASTRETPWQSKAPNAGFTGAKPWLPVDPRHFDLAVDRQQGNPDSVYESVRAFLQFRKRQPALLHGDLEFRPLKHNVLTFVRSTAEQALFLSFNLDRTEHSIPLQELGVDGRLSVLRSPAGKQGRIESESLVLPAYSMLIADIC